jgi:hypothetical protein
MNKFIRTQFFIPVLLQYIWIDLKLIMLIVFMELFFCLNLNAQSHIEINLDIKQLDSLRNCKSIPKNTLLDIIKWDSLVQMCNNDNDKRCLATVKSDESFSEYEFMSDYNCNYIIITTYCETVLSFYIDIQKTLRVLKVSYFDKPAWIEYSQDILKNENMRLTEEESQEIIQSYYRLLGVGVRNEYGWICEYSTVGMPPDQRIAAIILIKNKRVDLLRKVLNGENIVGSVYAADALFYLDYLAKVELEEFYEYKKEEENKLEKLELSPDIRQGWEHSFKNQEKIIRARLLSEEDREKIDLLRSDNLSVTTCGNSGSYKQYKKPVSEVLSDSEIENIADNYKHLDEAGYFRYSN